MCSCIKYIGLFFLLFYGSIGSFAQSNNFENKLNTTIKYPESDGLVLEKKLIGFYISDTSGNLLEPSKLVFDGSIVFDCGAWNTSGLPVVFGMWEFQFKYSSGSILEIENNSFSNAYSFSNGFAIVQKGNRYNFINTSGKVLSKIWFDYAEDYNNGLALVAKGTWINGSFSGKFGYIDTLGAFKTPLLFECAESFSNNKARVWLNGKILLINTAGMQLAGNNPKNMLEAGLSMFNNNSLRFQRPDVEDATIYPLKMAPDSTLFPKNIETRWGFAEKNGAIRIPTIYDYVLKFYEGVAAVKKDEKWTFINPSGSRITEDWFDDVQNFKHGLAKVKNNGKSAIVDRNGNYIVPFINPVRFFVNGFACIEYTEDKNKKFNFISTNGTSLFPPLIKVNPYRNGLSEIEREDGMLATIDSACSVITDWHCRVVFKGSDVEIIENKGLYKYRNREGLVTTKWMTDTEMFREGTVAIKGDSAWGYIDRNGKTVIDFQYDECWDFSNGLAVIKKNGLYNLINKQNRIITDWYNEIGLFSEGLAPASLKGKWGFINDQGQIAVKFNYDWVSEYNEGIAVVKKGRKYGYINKKGKKITPIRFSAAGAFNKSGIAQVRYGKTGGYIDKSGTFYGK
jgi:hypothetical protein